MKQVAFAGAFAATLLVAFTASATKTNFTVDLDSSQENADNGVNPPLVLNGHSPHGTANMTYDDVTKHLCGVITWADLTGPATGIHLHQAPDNDPTGDGTVKLLIAPPAGNASTVNFNFTLDAAFEKSLMAPTSTFTELYLNIHTTLNSKGEDRTFTPWTAGGATEVPCGTPTNPDGGVSSSSSSSGDAGGTPIPIPTTTSTTPPANTSSGSTGTSGTSGLGAPTGDDAAPAPKKGCSASGSPANALSMAFIVGLGVLAAGGRLRRRSKR